MEELYTINQANTTHNTKSFSVHFAKLVLYEISPRNHLTDISRLTG